MTQKTRTQRTMDQVQVQVVPLQEDASFIGSLLTQKVGNKWKGIRNQRSTRIVLLTCFPFVSRMAWVQIFISVFCWKVALEWFTCLTWRIFGAGFLLWADALPTSKLIALQWFYSFNYGREGVIDTRAIKLVMKQWYECLRQTIAS